MKTPPGISAYCISYKPHPFEDRRSNECLHDVAFMWRAQAEGFLFTLRKDHDRQHLIACAVFVDKQVFEAAEVEACISGTRLPDYPERAARFYDERWAFHDARIAQDVPLTDYTDIYFVREMTVLTGCT